MRRMPPDALCRCGHTRELHDHYRRGTDCALCGDSVCSGFKASGELASEQPLSSTGDVTSATTIANLPDPDAATG